MPNTHESGKPRVLKLTSVKLDTFLRLLDEIARDEHRTHLSTIIYDDYQQHLCANQNAKEALTQRRC
jgi:hypothetical protein